MTLPNFYHQQDRTMRHLYQQLKNAKMKLELKTLSSNALLIVNACLQRWKGAAVQARRCAGCAELQLRTTTTLEVRPEWAAIGPKQLGHCLLACCWAAYQLSCAAGQCCFSCRGFFRRTVKRVRAKGLKAGSPHTWPGLAWLQLSMLSVATSSQCRVIMPGY